MDLDLNLSIGGCYRALNKTCEGSEKDFVLKSFWDSNSKFEDGDSREAREEHEISPKSAVSHGFVSDPESDAERKRAMQAMRRREAKRKREEKLQKRRYMNGVSGSDPEHEPPSKKEWTGRPATKDMNGRVATPLAPAPSPTPVPVPPYAVMMPPTQFPCVPYLSGFGLPYLVPVSDSGTGTPLWGLGRTAERGGLPEPNCSGDGGKTKMSSSTSGSQVCSSSMVSDCRGSSIQGGTRCDTKNGSTATSKQRKPDLNSSPCHPLQSAKLSEEVKSHPHEKAVAVSAALLASPSTPKEDVASESKPVPHDFPKGYSGSSSPPAADVGKPPRPPSLSLSKMPRVSTTGNGPDGRTVNGFLLKYTTSSEISIVCLCHGRPLSPTQFVEHAGGLDVTHPLRHITMVP